MGFDIQPVLKRSWDLGRFMAVPPYFGFDLAA